MNTVATLIQMALLFGMPPLAAAHLRHKRWEWAATCIGCWVSAILSLVLGAHA